ncbi:hypothetical protein BJX62DRAFT_142678 [Aspergillus germanicus]
MPIPVEGNPNTTITTLPSKTSPPIFRTYEDCTSNSAPGPKIHLPELLSLALLAKLEELHLTSSVPYFPIPDITDTNFTSLISALGNLRELILYCVQENLTTISLIALGKSYQSLVLHDQVPATRSFCPGRPDLYHFRHTTLSRIDGSIGPLSPPTDSAEELPTHLHLVTRLRHTLTY